MLYTQKQLCSSLLIVQLVSLTMSYRTWRTMYMDEEEDCESLVRNDDMSEGDAYRVVSDNWEGESKSMQRPAECSNGFNFGDRLVSVHLKKWWCSDNAKEPFLAIYEDCEGRKKNFMAKFNCSSSNLELPTPPVYSSGSCISLYHYRGHTRGGYHFSVEVKARHEIIEFPAGGIAALVICAILVIMVLVKCVCAITGYEERLPKLNLDPEEQKQILESAAEFMETIQRHQNPQYGEEIDNPVAENLINPGENQQYPTKVVTGERGHRVLRVTRSNGSGGRPSTSAGQQAQAAEFEYDYFDLPLEGPTTPRLNRFPSFKGASIWRSK